MPEFTDGDLTLHYEVTGDGFPVLAIAPGGMRSSIDRWDAAPWNPVDQLRDDYRVIAMDQRNAGSSTGPVGPDSGWDTYTVDQLALLDHLGVQRCHVVGMCIGGPYIMGLIAAAPDRIASAVMMQPIGLDDNRGAFFELFDGWAAERRDDHPEATDADWHAFRHDMFGGEFMFNADEDDVARCPVPLLVLMGADLHHPTATSRRVAELAPRAELIEAWKDPADQPAARAAVADFLATHTPED